MKILVCILVVAALVAAEDAKPNEEKPKGKRGLVDLGYGLPSHDLGLSYGQLISAPAHAPRAIIGEPVVKSVVITKEVPVGIPQPYPVHVVKHVAVPVKVPVAVPVDRPVPYPVHVVKHVPVDRPVPVAVPQPYPVHVDRPVPVAVPQPYPVVKHVAVPVAVPQPIHVRESHPIVYKQESHLDLGLAHGLDGHGLGLGHGLGHAHL